MKLRFLASLSIVAITAAAQQPVDLVSPLVGTASKHSLSTGNTYPTIGMPWGMHFWTPQTGKMGDGWAYTYDADKIVGFKQTHQPSPWMNDYGQFAFMPGSGHPVFKEEERASWFSHKAETVKPHYYSVYLADHDLTTELVPTERAAMVRITYNNPDSPYLVIDAVDSGSYVKVMPAERKIIGYSHKNSRGVPANFKNYFVIYLDHAIDYVWMAKDKNLVKDAYEMQANHAGAVIGIKTKKGDKVHLKIASSFISYEQAEQNLRSELVNYNFDQLKDQGRKTWNEKLSRITITGGTEDQQKTFYSCLYRSLLFPQKHYEITSGKKIVHYSPYNGQTLPGYMFAGTGFWDTFRALYPFLNLMYPSINKEMQEGLINDYKEGGWLPEWSSPGYRNIMVGNNSASVVADAWLKGLRGYDINTLYEALVKGANNPGPMTAVGRAGAADYLNLGYVPYEVIKESTARTLEYAYDDYCIAQLAKVLNKPADEVEYLKRSKNYIKVFDDTSKLMRGRLKDGSFQHPFNPFKWGDAFTEGNSWHYTWSVFHDVRGLVNLMGGDRIFAAMLDSVFNMPPIYDASYYGGVIHEIREMQVMNMGQYAHGNQPIQHMPYLYNYVGQPWKTQYWVREIMDRLYKPTPDGYCGDEDNGQTSAWYIFSALGFYPVCPASNQYVMGAPLFSSITMKLENGKTVSIKSTGKGAYVNTLKLNAQAYTRNYLKHEDLMKGATLQFDMSAKPNLQRGTSRQDFPASLSD